MKATIHFIKICLLLIFTTGSLSAQNPDLLDNNWYLHSATINGTTTETPISPEMTTQTTFPSNNEWVHDFCCGGSMEMQLMYDNNNPMFEITHTTSKLQTCPNPDNNSFRDDYISFFQNVQNNTLEYDIADSGAYKTLTLTDQDDNTLIFSDRTLHENYVLEYDYDHWYLQHLIIDGVSHHPTNNGDFDYVTASFDENGTFHTEVCQTLTGQVWTEDWELFFLCHFSPSFAGSNCTDSENNDFEVLYFNFFTDNITEKFQMTTGNIYDQGCGGDYRLFGLIDVHGNEVLFGECPPLLDLPTSISTSFTIHPNPTQNILHLQTPAGANLENINLYDVQGRQTAGFPNGSTQLDVSALPAGVYFLALTVDGQRTVRKVVKE